MKQCPSPTRIAWGAALLGATGLVLAQAPAPASLADLSLEQLSTIQVTTVGKRMQRLADVAGSVYVISQEDIRRSGAVTLPEALRLAPNLQVARADANQYAITTRGFGSVLANKMLVLIDGRTVYSPLFSGVFWEAQDVLLDDVERIEVLSGTGGTLYGSNAVNGVINIITRSAAETSGVVLRAGGGNMENLVGARWGGTGLGTPLRLYAKRYETDNTVSESGVPIRDAARRQQAGFRADRALGRDHLTVQGDVYDFRAQQGVGERQVRGANLLARWTRDSGTVRTQVQAYLDRAQRNQPGSVDDTLDTVDLDLQQTSQPWPGHEFLWGAGYRRHHDSLVNLAPAVLQLLPPERQLHLWNVFAQDEVRLPADVRLTLGLKAEHNTYTGLEWLPTARLAWHPAPGQLLWASASRAVRTPARIDRDTVIPGVLLGGAGFDSEIANVFELGWRAQPRRDASYSITLFHHRFERLRSLDLVPGGAVFGNSFEGRLTGIEAWGSWRILEPLRLQAGLVHQRLHLDARPGSTPAPGGAAQLGNDPRTRAQVGLAWDLNRDMELDLHLRRVGSLPSPQVPGYTAVDLRWGWRVRPELELSVSGRNLTDRRHPEWGAPGGRAELPRSIFVRAMWRL